MMRAKLVAFGLMTCVYTVTMSAGLVLTSDDCTQYNNCELLYGSEYICDGNTGECINFVDCSETYCDPYGTPCTYCRDGVGSACFDCLATDCHQPDYYCDPEDGCCKPYVK